MEKLISLIIPAYNEADNIHPLYQEILKIWPRLAKRGYNCEMIFVNDGSHDATSQILAELADADTRVKLVEFSRNFGKEIAVSAGLHHARGEAAISLDADLQHPPRLIPEFVAKWEKGAEIVAGINQAQSKEGLVRKFGTVVFYWLMEQVGEGGIKLQATDYRLLDKKVVEEFKRFSERNRLTRGLVDWLGFKKDRVYFKAERRPRGRSSYNFLQLLSLGFSGLAAHSLFPLRLAGFLGLGITVFAAFLGSFMLINQYILGDPWRLGFSNLGLLAVFILFLIGIVLSCLGLIALYIAHIHQEVVNRPLYVIRSRKNF